MPGEAARSGERALGAAIDVDGQRQGGPDQRRLPLDEGSSSHPAGGGQARAPARGLHEAHPAITHFGFPLDIGKLHRLEFVMQPGYPDRRRSHQAAALVAAIDDPPGGIDVDPGAELVGETKAVRHAERLEVQVL
jgi:hypothetical protein